MWRPAAELRINRINRNRIPLFRGSLIINTHRGAAIEGIPPDRGDGNGDDYRSEGGAALEGALPDGSHRIGDSYRSEGGAVIEGTRPNGADRIGDGYRSEGGAAREAVSSTN